MTLIVDISGPKELSEVISDQLWVLGVMAIEEFTIGNNCVTLRTTLGEDRVEAERAVASIYDEFKSEGDISIVFQEISDASADTWREFAQPIFIESDVVIVPAWIDFDRSIIPTSTPVIAIEPGATFGLGDHPTTRASLQLLSRCLEPTMHILDVGCGSGVLGIAALVMGAKSALGIDINAASDSVSTVNARANAVASKWQVKITDLDDGVVDELLDLHPHGFEIITANILAPVLIRLAPAFHRLLAQVGTLVISGVLSGHFNHVTRALAPLAVTDQVDVDGWSAVAYRFENNSSRHQSVDLFSKGK